jgi:cell shape-determining protein MreC
MTKPMMRIHNAATDEIIDREMTETEYAEYQAQNAKDAIKTQERETLEADKTALLAKLGITADEAAILLG